MAQAAGAPARHGQHTAPSTPGWPTGNAQWPQVRGPSKAVGGVKSAAGEQASPALRDSPPLTSPTALTTGYNPAPLFSGSGVRRGEPHQHTPWWRLAHSVPRLDSEHGAVTGRRLERGGPSSSLSPNLSHRGGSSARCEAEMEAWLLRVRLPTAAPGLRPARRPAYCPLLKDL